MAQYTRACYRAETGLTRIRPNMGFAAGSSYLHPTRPGKSRSTDWEIWIAVRMLGRATAAVTLGFTCSSRHAPESVRGTPASETWMPTDQIRQTVREVLS